MAEIKTHFLSLYIKVLKSEILTDVELQIKLYTLEYELCFVSAMNDCMFFKQKLVTGDLISHLYSTFYLTNNSLVGIN